MATETDICNLALANLGHAAKVSSINPADGSVEAMHCARFYPIARKLTLAKHDWGFATRRALLAERVVGESMYADYGFAYTLPQDYVRFIGFVDTAFGMPTAFPGSDDYQVEAADDGTLILLCNVEPEAAHIRYVWDETNPGRYPETFIDVLGYELAAKLAGPIRKGDRRDDMLKAAAASLMVAAGVDSNVDNRERRRRMEYVPGSIEARR